MTSQLEASTPVQVHGLPQPSDRFPYRYRNQAPLILRQIVPNKVLDQWSNDPDHVVQSLNQQYTGKEETRGQIDTMVQVLDKAIDGLAICGIPDLSKEAAGSGATAPEESSPATKIAEGTGAANTVNMEEAALTLMTPPSSPPPTPLLTVMVAEDTKNFMDNPQFTKKIEMSAKEIADRVLLTPRSTPPSSCPLCDSHTQNTRHPNHDASNVHPDLLNGLPKDDRFYYRGKVPPSLYSDLQIPALLDSLSLPKESTSFANAPNKDLMRIWISLAGATTPLHYDKCHGILIQVVGRKRFVVFSHEDTNLLYPYDGLSGPRHASKVRGLGHCFPFKDQAKAEGQKSHLKENEEKLLERWPRVSKVAAAWVIDLEPGDALYTPPGFWHEVTSVDHSVSVTVAWDMDKNEIQEVPPHMAF
ncbi:hypothetical protein EMPS_07116 [Entomortierella parvispora]|uniref:JmjC domain-containing protein n=1 Tax=Entomortierella parvispora TaxID=205924 RepID=A0A9P3HDZ7_9FUNG|nr:hypothetical protein EMPS_07116 [Entomortierella parvispora]